MSNPEIQNPEANYGEPKPSSISSPEDAGEKIPKIELSPERQEQSLDIDQPLPDEATTSGPTLDQLFHELSKPSGITTDSVNQFTADIANNRSWEASVTRILRWMLPFGKRKNKNSSMQYAEATNYSDIFPYEACFAGESYCRLLINLIKDSHVLEGNKPTIVELGCGAGNLLEELEKSFSARLVGVDYHEPALRYAQQRVLNVDFYLADLNRINSYSELLNHITGNQSVDLFIAMDVVEHLDTEERQNMLINAIFESLKPSGIAIIGMPEKPSKQDQFLRRLFKKWWNKVDKDVTHYNKPTPERFDELVQNFTKIADMRYFPFPAPFGRMAKMWLSANRLMVLMKRDSYR